MCLNTYVVPSSVQLDVDRRNISFREEEDNKKTWLYVYTASLLATPLNIHVHHMPLYLYNGIPGVVLRIGKKTNNDTTSFLAHVDTCNPINTVNLLLPQYIMTKHPSIVAGFSNTMTHTPSILFPFNVQ